MRLSDKWQDYCLIDTSDGDMDILSLLVKTELAPSRSDARRAVEQGGVSVADEKVTDIRTAYNADSFGADGLVLKFYFPFFCSCFQ